MSIRKRLPEEFGLIYPTENDVFWTKQGGGFSCTQHSLEGIYFPLGELRHNLGYPDWSPDGPEFERKLREKSLETISDRDYKTIPDHIQERGYFETVDEYWSWVDDSEYYGWITLWDDLYRFTYGVWENLDSDPRKRWDSVDDLWDSIDNTLPFSYEKPSYIEYKESDLSDSYPRMQAAIKPINITSAREPEYEFSTDLRDLVGETVFLLCPNAD